MLLSHGEVEDLIRNATQPGMPQAKQIAAWEDVYNEVKNRLKHARDMAERAGLRDIKRIVDKAVKALAAYKEEFQAEQRLRLLAAGLTANHAENILFDHHFRVSEVTSKAAMEGVQRMKPMWAACVLVYGESFVRWATTQANPLDITHDRYLKWREPVQVKYTVCGPLTKVSFQCTFDPVTQTCYDFSGDAKSYNLDKVTDEFITLPDGTELRAKDGVTFDH